jgi:hypothetical protein
MSIPLANAADYQVIVTAAPATSQSEDAECQQFSIDDESVPLPRPTLMGDAGDLKRVLSNISLKHSGKLSQPAQNSAR